MNLPSGAIGQFEVSWTFRGGMDLRDEVAGTHGTIWLNHFLRTGFEMFSAGGGAGYVAEKAETAAGWLFPVGDEVSELGYVKQDQQTLSHKSAADDDFSHEPAEVHVEAEAKLEFDKAAWSERLKKCSAKAITPQGKATRGTCGVVFQLNTSYFVNSEGTVIQQSWTNAQLSVSVGVKSDDGVALTQ